MTDIVSFANLPPGLYQVAAPGEVEALSAPVTLREDDHFWAESKNRKTREKDASGDDVWESVPIRLHAGTPGLLVQAEQIGARAFSRVVELDRQRIRVVAWGYMLGSDGLLEVIEKSKEYDMAAELMKAALKEAKRVNRGKPDDKQSVALVKTASEETALALVSALPSYSRAKIMEARLEVQTHREALCRTKSENQVLRYFIQKRGGVLKAKPGVGEVTANLTAYRLVRKLDSGQVRDAAEALFGSTPPQPAKAEPSPEPEEPPVEDTEVIEAEVIDVSDAEAAAEEGEPEGSHEHDARSWPAPEEEPAPTICQTPDCPEKLTPAVIKFCQSAAGQAKFGGDVICMKCQKRRREAAEADGQ